MGDTMILLNVPFRVVEKSMMFAEEKEAVESPNGGSAFTTPDEAIAEARKIGCVPPVFHTIWDEKNGRTLYLPCKDSDARDEAASKSPDADCDCNCGKKESSTDIRVKDPGSISEDELGEGVLIEGPVSSGVTDRDGDIVDPGAVMKAWDEYKKNPIILHNPQRGGIGKMVDVRMGEWPGLDHKVPIGTALIDGSEKEIVHKVRKGIIRAFSIGFIAKSDGIERTADEDGRVSHRFIEIDWVETSVVDIPSNPMALFDVVKDVMRVQTKSAAPDSFNNPFSMWVFSKGEKMSTDTVMETVNEDELVVEEPTTEEPVTEIKETSEMEMETEDTEVTEDPVEDIADDVSPEEEDLLDGDERRIKELEDKVDTIVEAVLSLKEMTTETEDPEVTELRAQVAEFKEQKAVADREAEIEAEVQRRVAEITDGETRSPERKSITETTAQEIPQDAFTQLAEERNCSVGQVKGEAWLATLLASRRKQ